jgi:hypothetical protein
MCWAPWAAAVGAIVCLSATPAAAIPEPPAPAPASEPPEVEDARDAYKLGVSLTKQGQWSDALAAFERSFRLKPDAVTAFDIGYCERALGRLTRARKSFGRALRAPELPLDKATEARGYLAEIEIRLARVVITVGPGARVAVDGRPLEGPAGGGAAELVAGTREPGPPEAVGSPSCTLVLDPGTHVIVVGAAGSPDAVVTRELVAGATTTLTLAPGTSAAAATLPEKPAPASPTRRTGAVIAFGAGGLSALVGVAFGALALKDKGSLDGVCPQKDQCAIGSQGTIDALNTFATVSTVGLVAAAASAGVGTFFLLTEPRPTPTTTMTLHPFVSSQGSGLRWVGSF